MKKLYTLLAAVILTTTAFAQAPEKMSYQAVVRDAGNALITDQAVGLQISILQGSASGTAVYVETQRPNTNINGLVSIEIGSGTVVSGAFNTIDWSDGPYFIKTETDPTGGTTYTITGTSQLMSVPYALYAKTSGSSTPGPQGPIGLTGLQGLKGDTGVAGPQGLIGLTGLQGLKGDTGVAGPQGLIGLTGLQGLKGDTGVAGPQGPIGLTGLQGLKGDTGAVGPQGPIGLTGLQGAQGIQGLKGDTGVAGIQGTQGIQGLKGDTGVVGPQGATGLLSNGAAAGNTPYWDGSQWVVNSSNIHNNGSGIGIGTTSPDSSAITEMNSTTQGFLPPRMTNTQRDAIAAPAVGLVIYNTTSNCLNFYVGSNWHETCGSISPPLYPPGSVFCASGATTVVDVTNPTTGEIWMDRNLGATRAATSSTDSSSYGDLYQWGRGSDGHQCRTSTTTTTLSSTDQPGNSNFIIGSQSGDWRSSQNNNLWQGGVNGINNPCPSGYRLPTETELTAERLSWSTNNSNGAITSPLKLPVAGARFGSGSLYDVNSRGSYWCSTLQNGTSPRLLRFGSSFVSHAYVMGYGKAEAFSVRCIKD